MNLSFQNRNQEKPRNQIRLVKKREMENGDGHLGSKFAGLTVSNPNNINGSDGLFQAMKAVDAAKTSIKQQMEENNRLRSELHKRNEELEKYKSTDVKYQNPQFANQWGENEPEPSRTDQVVLHLGNQIGDGGGNVEITSKHDSLNSFAVGSDPIRSTKTHAMRTHIDYQNDRNTVNGLLNMAYGGQAASDNSGISKILSPSITLFTPTRYQHESNLDLEFRYSERDLISVADSSSKQDVVVKIREHEDEILQLKKHLTEYSLKEAKISNEKYALEKRISYMHLALDQQQQDLILAASKAVSYRQDIMEENVRLTYALQAAQQERSTFITLLMPLLTEYSLQLPVANAQSIVTNVKVLLIDLQEQLLVTEGKLKELQYQLAPWRSDAGEKKRKKRSLFFNK